MSHDKHNLLYNVELITFTILDYCSLNDYYNIRQVNLYYMRQIDNYLLYDWNRTKKEKLTFDDLDHLHIIQFHKLYTKHKSLYNMIPDIVKYNCVSLCDFLYRNNYIYDSSGINAAMSNGNIKLIKYFYNKLPYPPNINVIEKFIDDKVQTTFTEDDIPLILPHIIPRFKIQEDEKVKTKIEIIDYLAELNVKPSRSLADSLAGEGRIDLLLILEKYNINCSEAGAGKALLHSQCDTVKFLFSRNILPNMNIVQASVEDGNLEMISWLWDNNLRIDHSGITHAIKNGHLHIIKFAYKKGICFKDQLSRHYQALEDEERDDDEDDDEDDEENNNEGENNNEVTVSAHSIIRDWINDQQKRIFIVPNEVDFICERLYRRIKCKRKCDIDGVIRPENRDIDEMNMLKHATEQRHIEMILWFRKHCHITPTTITSLSSATPPLEVIKFLYDINKRDKEEDNRNIINSGKFSLSIPFLNKLVYEGQMSTIKYLYDVYHILPINNAPSAAITIGNPELADMCLDILYNEYLKSLDINLQQNTENNNEAIKYKWYSEHIPGIEFVNELLINNTLVDNYIKTLQWAINRNIELTHITANFCLRDTHLHALKFLYDNNVLPVINQINFGSLIHSKNLKTLKFLIEKNIINSYTRLPFTRQDIIRDINTAAFYSTEESLFYLYRLNLLDMNGNRLNLFPDNQGIYGIIRGEYINILQYFMDRIFMMYELEKLCLDNSNDNNSNDNNNDDSSNIPRITSECHQFFPKQDVVNLLARKGQIELIERISKYEFLMEDNITKICYFPNVDGANLAAKNGLLKLAVWLDQRGIRPNSQGLNMAAYEGHIHILRYFTNELQMDFISEDTSSDIQDNLKLSNIKRTGQIILPDQATVDTLCNYNHIHIIKFLVDKGLLPSQAGANNAIGLGNLGLLDYLYSINILPNRAGIRDYILIKYPDVKLWLQEHGL